MRLSVLLVFGSIRACPIARASPPNKNVPSKMPLIKNDKTSRFVFCFINLEVKYEDLGIFNKNELSESIIAQKNNVKKWSCG